MKFLVFTCLVFSSIPVFAFTEKKSLDSLLQIIKDKSDFYDIKPLSLKLYQDASDVTDSSINYKYRMFALLYLMERNNVRRSETDEFESSVNAFRSLYDKARLDSILPEDAFQFEFAFYYYIIHVKEIKKNSENILDDWNDLEQFVLTNPNMRRRKELNHRMYQIAAAKASIFQSVNNFERARASLVQSLEYAKNADDELKQSKGFDWGFTKGALIKLLKFARITKDINLFSECLNGINANKSKAFNSLRQRELYKELSSSNDIELNEYLILIKSIENNPLANSYPEIFINITRYLLSKDSVYLATKYLDKARGLEANNRDNISFNADIHGLEGMKYFLINDHTSMNIQLDSALLIWNHGNNLNQFRIDPLLCSDFLSRAEEYLKLYMRAYKISCDTVILRKALYLTKIALPNFATHRAQIYLSQDRIKFSNNLKSLTELALSAFYLGENLGLLSDDDNEIIIEYFELNKSYNLKTDRDFIQKLPDTIRNRYHSLADSLDYLRTQIDSTPLSTNALSMMFTDLTIRLQELIEQYFQLKLMNRDILYRIRDQLNNSQSAIEIFTGEEHIYTFLINKNKIVFLRQPNIFYYGNETLSIHHLINRLTISLNNALDDNLDQMTRTDNFKYASNTLFTSIFTPLQPHIRYEVMIIPDAEFSDVPFAALLTQKTDKHNCKDWPFWIKTNLISKQHSIAMWLDNLRGERNKSYPFDLIAFAPYFDNLIFNIPEGRILTNTFNPSKLFSDSLASKNNFKQNTLNARILHIASHASSDQNDEEKSYIRFQQDTLKSIEINNMDIHADMVFLSACETGIGKVVPSEGVMSLARSFISSGARSVVSTLWKINDKISKDQVVAIYKNLQLNKPKDEAIRDMQIAYLDHCRTSEKAFPYYWAAYQCEGDLRPLFTNKFTILINNLAFLPTFIFILFGLGAYFLPTHFSKSNLNQAA